jgi:prepilin-type N-terminal cleavage/methylation domain-containing protein
MSNVIHPWTATRTRRASEGPVNRGSSSLARRVSVSHIRRRSRRPGVTLVEMLVVIAVSLILIFAVVQIFQVAGQAVQVGRATLEMAGQLRTVSTRLRLDLEGLTVPARPWPRSSSAMGYFEYYEGPMRDNTWLSAADNTFGDFDDVLMFTAHAIDEPFTGRYGRNNGLLDPGEDLNGNGALDPGEDTGIVISSRVAEIIWWTHFQDNNGNGTWDGDEEITLHRRVLLIRPDLNMAGFAPVNFFNDNDVSARPNAAGTAMLANTLADLTKRENRFAHNRTTFPYVLNLATLQSLPATNALSLVQSGNSLGEDVVLSHVVGFDVRVYDPTAQVRSDTVHALVPGDRGYAAGNLIGLGAFVDLNYAGNSTSFFSGAPHPRSQLGSAVYDTWSFHYEHDGVDQDGDGTIDEGTNGLDDDNQNGVDDVGERETSPPYPVPLRGLQVTLRIIEHDTQQVRQVTVVSDFTPE